MRSSRVLVMLLAMVATINAQCFPGQFSCNDGQCIRSSGRCNGTRECTDGSDETTGCLCTSSQFLCDNGRCISSASRCNGRLEVGGIGCGAPDFDDERGCSVFRCLPQAIVNLRADIQVRCSVTTNGRFAVSTPVCVYDDQPSEICNFTFVIEIGRFTFGEHTLNISVRDTLLRNTHSQIIPFRRVPTQTLDFICSLDSLPSGGSSSISCTANNALSRAPFCEYDGGAISVECSNSQAQSFTVDIPFNIGFGSHSVTISITDVFAQDASATLQFVITAQNGDLRLSRGSLSQANYTSGRLEIFINGQWGTVCDDSFSLIDATVACRQLGYSGARRGPIISSSRISFGSGSGTIWLDDVGCTGSESCLHSCSNRGIGSNNCNHTDDVAIFCSGTRTPGADCSSPATPATPSTITTVVTANNVNLVGITVGVTVAAFVLFGVITIVVVIVMGLCVARSVRAAASSSKHSHTAAVTTTPAPAAANTDTVTAGSQQTAYPLTTDPQSHSTAIKQAPPSARPVEIEMQAQQNDQPQEAYPPSLQGGYPPQ